MQTAFAGILGFQNVITDYDIKNLTSVFSRATGQPSVHRFAGAALAGTAISSGPNRQAERACGDVVMLANSTNVIHADHLFNNSDCRNSGVDHDDLSKQRLDILRSGLLALRGGFALAAYQPHEKKLVLIRDPIGIKSLYYVTQGGRFYFGSRIGLLLALLPETPDIDPGAFGEYLQAGFVDGDKTLVRSMHRVLPGELVEVDKHLNIRHFHYWSLNDGDGLSQSSQRGYAERDLQKVLSAAVADSVESSSSPGLLLSSGTDSVALLALMKRARPEKVFTFTLGYSPCGKHCEIDDASVIARDLGSIHVTLRIDAAKALRRMPNMVWASDELINDPATLPLSFLSEAASHSCDRIITGDGADEVFGADRAYRRSRLSRWYRNIQYPGTFGVGTKPLFQDNWIDQVLIPHAAKAAHDWRTPQLRRFMNAPDEWSFLRKSQYTDVAMALPNQYAIKVERQAIAFGLSTSLPYMDTRVIDFGLGLEDGLKVQGNEGKILLKRWVRNSVASPSLSVKKRGLSVPTAHWISSSELGKVENALLRHEALTSFCRIDGLKALFNAYRQGRGTNREIWSLLQFALWYRIFVDGRGVMPELSESLLDWL